MFGQRSDGLCCMSRTTNDAEHVLYLCVCVCVCFFFLLIMSMCITIASKVCQFQLILQKHLGQLCLLLYDVSQTYSVLLLPVAGSSAFHRPTSISVLTQQTALPLE